MDFLDKPDISVPPEQIFEECVKGYQSRSKQEKLRNEMKQERLMQCKDAVKTDSEGYKEGILHGNFKQSSLPETVSKKDLAKVYSDTFSKEGKPGRRYYERIKSGLKNGRCPICGNRCKEPDLDHYLPKSIFPTLCVTPDNLIPICRICNRLKRTKYSLVKDKRFLHLYYDRLPVESGRYKGDKEYQQTFLMARIESNYTVTFYSSYPKDWDPELCSRIENHMVTYHLYERFAENVDQETAEFWSDLDHRFTHRYPNDPRSEEEILQDLIAERMNRYYRSPNTWKSALYRGMDAQRNIVYAWFKEINMDH